METKYISAVNTAKLIRKALKESFPSVKFSVRTSTYSGGASVRVAWTDGPTEKQVSRVAGVFEGATFDGMQDLKEYRRLAMDSQLVHFSADFVFCNRSYSVGLVTRGIIAVAMRYGTHSIPEAETFFNGRAMTISPMNSGSGHHWSWEQIIRRTLENDGLLEDCENPCPVVPQPSPTAARVEVM